MHHIPGAQLRQELLEQLTPLLQKSTGQLWVTLWHPPQDKKLPPELVEKVCQEYEIPLSDLEPGDTFYGWQHTDAVRYVHHIDDAEVQQWARSLSVKLEEDWQSEVTGERGNRCLRFTHSQS